MLTQFYKSFEKNIAHTVIKPAALPFSICCCKRNGRLYKNFHQSFHHQHKKKKRMAWLLFCKRSKCSAMWDTEWMQEMLSLQSAFQNEVLALADASVVRFLRGTDPAQVSSHWERDSGVSTLTWLCVFPLAVHSAQLRSCENRKCLVVSRAILLFQTQMHPAVVDRAPFFPVAEQRFPSTQQQTCTWTEVKSTFASRNRKQCSRKKKKKKRESMHIQFVLALIKYMKTEWVCVFGHLRYRNKSLSIFRQEFRAVAALWVLGLS